MTENNSIFRFIAVYEDRYEVREGTERDMAAIVDEDCGNGGLVNDKGTVIDGVRMLYQDGDYPEENFFSNPFSGPFDRYHHRVAMNFVLVGADGDDDYRSLTDEEAERCLSLLKAVFFPKMTVLLGGSQTYSELPEEVKNRLDFLMSRWAAFVVGDSEGADRLMQEYLHGKNYPRVTVYGSWDRAMADMADEGLFLWDGESQRTRENIIFLREQDKAVSIFRTNGPWCWEEKATRRGASVSDDSLKDELKRYEEAESICIKAAIRRCPRAEKALRLKRDESFLLYRSAPEGQAEVYQSLSSYRPFLSFADVLAAIRDEMVGADQAAPKPSYVLEKWTSRGDFNLSFFRFKDELIEVEPPNEDYHMEQTARFELEGDEVVRFRT